MDVRFELQLSVHADDIDGLGHVNNVVYLRWVQEVAAAHWSQLSTPQQRTELAWVVLRHEIDYHAPALPGDTIVATTWVEGWKGVRSERRVQLHERSSGKLLAEAKTIWVLLDAQTRRPKRIEDALGGLLTGAKET